MTTQQVLQDISEKIANLANEVGPDFNDSELNLELEALYLQMGEKVQAVLPPPPPPPPPPP